MPKKQTHSDRDLLRAINQAADEGQGAERVVEILGTNAGLPREQWMKPNSVSARRSQLIKKLAESAVKSGRTNPKTGTVFTLPEAKDYAKGKVKSLAGSRQTKDESFYDDLWDDVDSGELFDDESDELSDE